MSDDRINATIILTCKLCNSDVLVDENNKCYAKCLHCGKFKNRENCTSCVHLNHLDWGKRIVNDEDKCNCIGKCEICKSQAKYHLCEQNFCKCSRCTKHRNNPLRCVICNKQVEHDIWYSPSIFSFSKISAGYYCDEHFPFKLDDTHKRGNSVKYIE